MTTYIMKTHQIMGLSRIWAHLQLQHLHFLPPLNQSNKVIPTQQRLEKNLCKNVVFISTHRNFAGHHQMKFCNSRYYVTFHLRSKAKYPLTSTPFLNQTFHPFIIQQTYPPLHIPPWLQNKSISCGTSMVSQEVLLPPLQEVQNTHKTCNLEGKVTTKSCLCHLPMTI